jgi:hypothetical protein
LVCGVKCESDQLLVNGKCEVFQCKSYQELTVNSSGVLNVPKRDISTGICYYTKVINTNVVNGQDQYRQDRVTENIISRDHDAPNSTYAGNIKPKNIGSKSLQILLNDMRSLKLVGKDKTNESKLYVDNYFLIRMNSDTYAHAYGTRDAGFDTKDQYGNWYANSKYSDYILFNDKEVKLKHYIDGGTAYVPPIDITGEVKVGVQTDLHIHALDCGGGQHVDDVYLLLQ